MPTKGYRIGDTAERDAQHRERQAAIAAGPPHEDRHVFAVWSPNAPTAIRSINKTGTANFLRMMVPGVNDDSYWLIFKDDSWVKEQWRTHFPDALLINSDEVPAVAIVYPGRP